MTKEEKNQKNRAWYHANKENRKKSQSARRQKNKDRVNEINRRSYENNKTSYFSRNAIRQRATQLRVFPGDSKNIASIYEFRDRLNKIIVNVCYVVDHVVPLNHELVCGLHVSWNLRVIPFVENAAKHNKWEPGK